MPVTEAETEEATVDVEILFRSNHVGRVVRLGCERSSDGLFRSKLAS
jgi:hypothetical protein